MAARRRQRRRPLCPRGLRLPSGLPARPKSRPPAVEGTGPEAARAGNLLSLPFSLHLTKHQGNLSKAQTDGEYNARTMADKRKMESASGNNRKRTNAARPGM